MSKTVKTKVASGMFAAIVMMAFVSACDVEDSQPANPTSSSTKIGSDLPTVEKSDQIAKSVPVKLRKSGKLRIVMTTSSPPAHFTTDNGMNGLDRDLAVLIGKVLGLKPKITGVPIDQVIPGFQADRYDVVVSQFKPTTDRAKVLDFVDYAQSGTTLGLLASNPDKLTPKKLCGHSVGVQKGSSQAVVVLPDLNKKCQKEGQKPVTKKTFRDSTSALLALRSSRVDGVLIDSPVMGYAAKRSNGKVVTAGTLRSNPVSIGTLKGSKLIKPVQKALELLHENGAYEKVFAKWGMKANTVTKFSINAVQKD
ncbi:ABC transporter substrate-binding protein [Spelaeicoccus albus]